MEQLRKEYEGMNLTDLQILNAKSLGLNKEQIIQFKIDARKTMDDFNELFNKVVEAMKPCIKECSVYFQKIVDSIEAAEIEIKPSRSKKGKSLKNWNSRKFYQ